MRNAALIFVLVIAQMAAAQYDIGLSGGVFTQSFKKNWFRDIPIPWSVSLSYRERVARHTDLGFDLNFVNARFRGSWSDGSRGGGSSVYASSVDLQYLQFSPYLDVRMEPKGNVVIRSGPQLGLKLSERLTGNSSHWSIMQATSQREYDNTTTDHFNDTDLRWMIGLGLRFGDKNGYALIIDPYMSYGFSALLQTSYARNSMMMFGVRLGFAKRFDRTPITRMERNPTRQSENAW